MMHQALDQTQKRCCACGRILLGEDLRCFECRSGQVLESVESSRPLWSYRLFAKNLLFQWKIMGQRNLSFFFAQAMHRVLKQESCMDFVLVPVPPRPGKIRKQGWDQIMELSWILRKKYGHQSMNLLSRRGKDQQKKKDRKARLENHDNFMLSRYGRKVLEQGNWPKKAIIIDDILTTGVTGENVARVLRQNGCERLKILTLFIVD